MWSSPGSPDNVAGEGWDVKATCEKETLNCAEGE